MENSYEAEIIVNNVRSIGNIIIEKDKLLLKVDNKEKIIPFNAISSNILTLENKVQLTLTNNIIVLISIYNNEILLNALNGRNNTQTNTINNKSSGKLLKIVIIVLIIAFGYMIMNNMKKDSTNAKGNNPNDLHSCSDKSYFISKAQSDLYYRFSGYSYVNVNSCKVGQYGRAISVTCTVHLKWVDAGSLKSSQEKVTYSCS